MRRNINECEAATGTESHLEMTAEKLRIRAGQQAECKKELCGLSVVSWAMQSYLLRKPVMGVPTSTM
jgi:hypothetical protein